MTPLRLALADLGFDRLRTALSVAGMASVVVCAFLMGALANSLSDFLAVPSSSANLIIIDGNYVDPGDSTLPASVIKAAEALRPQFVSRVSPLFYRQLRVNDRLVQVRAAPLADLAGAHHLTLVSGRWPTLANEVVIGEGLAASSGWDIGAVLTLYGRPMTVTGAYRSPGIAFAAIYLPLEVARDLFGPERLVQIVLVEVAPGTDAAAALRRLETDPAIAGQYMVFFEDSYTRRNTELLRGLLELLFIASGLSFSAVGLGAYMATALHLAERPREGALMRVSGLSRAQVGAYLLARAEALGAGAFVVGGLVAWAWINVLYSGGAIYVYNVPIRLAVGPNLALAYAGLTALSASAGALVATAGLQRVSIAQGLRR